MYSYAQPATQSGNPIMCLQFLLSSVWHIQSQLALGNPLTEQSNRCSDSPPKRRVRQGADQLGERSGIELFGGRKAWFGKGDLSTWLGHSCFDSGDQFAHVGHAAVQVENLDPLKGRPGAGDEGFCHINGQLPS